MKKHFLFVLLAAWSSYVFSDDIDLYVKNNTDTTKRPNVLIILDNSGSMLWDINDNSLGNGTTVNNTSTKAYLARTIIVDLINDNPDIDFGIQLFNQQTKNSCSSNCTNGGRIIAGINDLSIDANKTALMALLFDESTDKFTEFEGGSTPLCETLYETYRYLSGGQVYYGNDEDDASPPSIITSGNYTSPFNGMTCDKEVTVIYITDGEATRDSHAANVVPSLTGSNSKYDNNYLGNLGEWMGTKNWITVGGDYVDIDKTDKSDLVASVKIHTVGFGNISSNTTAVDLLKLASRDGIVAVEHNTTHDTPAGGQYHKASTAEDLKSALEGVIYDLTSSNLTSASVAANSFDRTQTLDSVYYGIFEPSNGARWSGNVKKYKIVNGEQLDSKNEQAVDSDGAFDADSKSFWSDEVDGNDVNKGGVAEMLRKLATSSRKLLTDINGTGALTTFSKTEITNKYNSDELLTGIFDVPLDEVSDIPNHISWAMGVDVDNEDDDLTTAVREDVFGDPLHSKPIVINYGSGNLRIVVGTNAGVLHMFEDIDDETVSENWAYYPSELFKNFKPLRENNIAIGNKVYGIDGEITLHINDIDKDGVVNGDDTVWLFYGLRRGGKSYYALDLTSPGTPKLMWHITNSGEYDKLGLTFSKPKVFKSELNTADDKHVVVFGGGYDVKKDSAGANAHDDELGTSIFMVNALLGGNPILEIPTGNKNGIASSVAPLDSDGDGYVDRLYVGDTGGSLWRVDMPDNSSANTSIFELAALGGVTNNDDRRFFNTPSIVRTYLLETYQTTNNGETSIVKQEVPYDAVLLGSGDKTDPLSSDTEDKFFMIKDKYIRTQTFGSAPATTVPAAITVADLYDYTDDPFVGYPDLTSTQEAELVVASAKSGWFYDLEYSGEKSSAKALVLNNIVYFTTYAPESETTCSVEPGNSWLYAVDLEQGTKKFDWSEDPENRSDKIKRIGSQWSGDASLISTTVIDEDGKITKPLIPNFGPVMGPPSPGYETTRESLTVPEN